MTQKIKMKAWRLVLVREECEFDLTVPDYVDPESTMVQSLGMLFINSEPENLKWQTVHAADHDRGIIRDTRS